MITSLFLPELVLGAWQQPGSLVYFPLIDVHLWVCSSFVLFITKQLRMVDTSEGEDSDLAQALRGGFRSVSTPRRATAGIGRTKGGSLNKA